MPPTELVALLQDGLVVSTDAIDYLLVFFFLFFFCFFCCLLMTYSGSYRLQVVLRLSSAIPLIQSK